MTDITLSGLHIYPIKSAAGISLERAQVQARGLEFDRRWMVVDSNHKFMTQRKVAKMALMGVEITDATLKVTAPDISPLEIPLPAPTEDLESLPQHSLTVEVWGDRCAAISTGRDSQAWLSEVLGKDCQLVYMPDSSDRPTDHGKFSDTQQVSFADAYPFLLISEASLADLNRRLVERQADPIPMNRFRPNLVVAGCDAFAEDTWTQIQIGTHRLTVAKACSRCVIPSIDQATGIKQKEPLPTLITFRHWDGDIWFGQNLIHTEPPSSIVGKSLGQSLGDLTVGDRLTLLS